MTPAHAQAARPFVALTGYQIGMFASAGTPTDPADWITGLGPYAAAAAGVWYMLRRSDRREDAAQLLRRQEDVSMQSALKESLRANDELRREIGAMRDRLSECEQSAAKMRLLLLLNGIEEPE